MVRQLRFSEIELHIGLGPALYEIHTLSGIKLKVGTTSNLRSRLLDHRASLQSALKLKPGGDRSRPQDVESKKSILAKHLYYDEAIASEYDLKTQAGRRGFLMNSCVILVEPTDSLQDEQIREEEREASGDFRYVGEVRIRRAEQRLLR